MNEEVRQVLWRILPFLAIIIGISIAIKRGKVTRADLFIQKPDVFSRLLMWWLFFLVFIIITEFTLYYFNVLKVGAWGNALLPSVLKIIGIVLLAPVAEELVFRGLFLHKLRQWKISKHLAVLLQALFFVALHSVAFQHSVFAYIGSAQVFLDAVLFAYAMYDTKSVYTPIVMHATGNLVAVLEQFILY